MKGIVEAKFSNCPHRAWELVQTGKSPLIEDLPASRFWGNGPDGHGRNQLGKILEAERVKLGHRNITQPTPNVANAALKPKVLLIGNSHLNGIDVSRVSHLASVEKQIAFTIDQAMTHSQSLQQNSYNLVVVHLVTNDVKENSAEEVMVQMSSFISDICTRVGCKVVVSMIAERQDSQILDLKSKQVCLLLEEAFSESDSVEVVNHTVSSLQGNEGKSPLDSDGIHLTRSGTIQLVAKIREAIHASLNLVTNPQSPPSSPGRRRRGQTPPRFRSNRRNETGQSYNEQPGGYDTNRQNYERRQNNDHLGGYDTYDRRQNYDQRRQNNNYDQRGYIHNRHNLNTQYYNSGWYDLHNQHHVH
jgi:hypothetical protein